jgi:beta-lactamase superfamily II metal-dependent hydrolase
LTIFQSDEGDCLLLEGQSAHLVLCDGGRGTAMRNEVRHQLAALREAGRELALIYVSHIDSDHIDGVLQLLEDEAEWRGYEARQQTGDPGKPPKMPRPPAVGGILHNAFREFISHNEKPVDGLLAARAMENLLATAAPALHATGVPDLVRIADEMQAIGTGIPQAIQVSKLIAPGALNIPLNTPPGYAGPAKLLYAERAGMEFDVGSMHFTLLGPTADDLEKLKEGWNNWLRSPEGKKKLKGLRAKVKEQIDEFSAGALTDQPFLLRDWEGVEGYKGVTVPNLASLMFMVEEDGKRLLLTGDGQQDYILAGLERTKFLGDRGLHVDVLKVQHHGSENNLDANFARRVSADHYVFCGNGSHENPDTRVIDFIYESRTSSKPDVRALAPEADGRDFHFWFSTSSHAVTAGTKKRAHFEAVEAHVEKLRKQAKGRLQVTYNGEVGVVLPI